MRMMLGQSVKHFSRRNNERLGLLPIIVGAVVFLCTKAAAWISFFVSHNRMPKGGFTAFLVGYLIEGVIQVVPFVVIGYFVRGLIRKGVGKTEIYLKMMFMLMPISILTAYWLFVYSQPFMRGALLFLNVLLVLVCNLLGKVAYKLFTLRC